VVVPPQVASLSGKPLSIAFEEVAAGKATYSRPDPEEEARLAAEAALAADAALAAETGLAAVEGTGDDAAATEATDSTESTD
jgi:hypothetical protein